MYNYYHTLLYKIISLVFNYDLRGCPSVQNDKKKMILYLFCIP